MRDDESEDGHCQVSPRATPTVFLTERVLIQGVADGQDKDWPDQVSILGDHRYTGNKHYYGPERIGGLDTP